MGIDFSENRIKSSNHFDSDMSLLSEKNNISKYIDNYSYNCVYKNNVLASHRLKNQFLNQNILQKQEIYNIPERRYASCDPYLKKGGDNLENYYLY